MSSLPPPDPATRSTVTGRPAWPAWAWIVLAVGLLVAYFVARIFV